MEKIRPKPEKQFQPLSPEVVWGHEYNIPTIVGEGSGGGFRLDNTYLPLEWENKVKNLENLYPKAVEEYFNEQAAKIGIKTPLITHFDEQNILRKLVFEDGSNIPPTLKLGDRFTKEERGEFEFVNVKNIKHALILHSSVSRWLSLFDEENDYPHIVGGNGYGPIDLKIPKEIKDKTSGYIREEIQMKYLLQAHAIAGSFGLEGCHLNFNEKGHIIFAEVMPGENGAYFNYDTCFRHFGCHNIDTPQQALALLSIVTGQFNQLLQLQGR